MTVKDNEGSTSETFGEATPISGESWPASGRVQAEMYGDRLKYIRNLRLADTYTIQTDNKGQLHYVLESGADIQERDGICLYVDGAMDPDYRVISIRPDRFLRMEVEHT